MGKSLIIMLVLVLLIALAVILFLRSPLSAALLKSKDHFLMHGKDARVMYEPGAEPYADAIASHLPAAVETVEQAHGRPFKNPVTVYVCATRKSCNEFMGQPPGTPARGASILGNVFISPLAFSFRGQDTHAETLTHELSHLHIRQRLGYWGTKRLVPVWFHEGLANMVGGSGGEIVGDEEAIGAILAGKHFMPDGKGTIIRMKKAHDYGLSYPMFHNQTRMFVRFMSDTYPDAFRTFLLDVQEGKPFAGSFSERFGKEIAAMWDEFEGYLRKTG